MKVKMFWMMLALLSIGLGTRAQSEEKPVSGSVGECVWNYDATTHTLTISGNGSTGDRTNVDELGYYQYRDEIEHIVIEEGVTQIGKATFAGMTTDKLVIPNSMKSIGTGAFFFCNVKELDLGDGLVEIREGGFTIIGTERVTIGKNLKRLEKMALRVSGTGDNPVDVYTTAEPFDAWADPEGGFTSGDILARFHLSTEMFRKWFAKYPGAGLRYMWDTDDMRSWNSGDCTIDLTPDYALLVNSNVTEGKMVDQEEYSWKTEELLEKVDTVVIAANVAKLGDGAFTGFNNVTDVFINREKPFTSWKSSETDFTATTRLHFVVDDLALWKDAYPYTLAPIHYEPCGTNLSWNIRDGVLTIEKIHPEQPCVMNDFTYNATAPWYERRHEILTAVLGEGLEKLGNMAFRDCSALTNVTLNSDMKSIGEYAFAGCTALSNLSLGEQVTTLGEYMLMNAGLTTITLPESITEIPQGCFYDCRSLQSAVMGNKVTTIGKSAFQNCDAMTDVNLPRDLQNLGEHAFKSSNALRDVYCIAATPITLPSDLKHLFSQPQDVRFHVVAGALELWQNKYPDAPFTFVEDTYTAESPLNISTRDDWQHFSMLVNSGLNTIHAQLTKDVDLGKHDMTVGTEAMPFKGTFNGNGYKLNSQIVASRDYTALFPYIEGATIANMQLTGKLYTKIGFTDRVIQGFVNCGALVACVKGTGNTIRGIRISQLIEHSGSYEPNSGIVGHINTDAELLIENTLFDGTMSLAVENFPGSTFPYHKSDNLGGFVGINEGKVTVKNCLYDSKRYIAEIDWYYHIWSHGLLSKLFVCGDGQGFSASAIYYITDAFITQQGTDASGMTSMELAKALGYGWTVDKNDKVVPLMMTPMKGEGTQSDPYLISSTEDWQKMFYFTNFESEKYKNAHWKQTADVTVLHPVVLKADPLQEATYDGQGHTITLELNSGAEGMAPFRNAENALISNLKVNGTVQGGLHTAGLIGFSNGKKVVVRNCHISATIICSGDADKSVNAHGGGIIGHGQQTTIVTLEGCVFDGHFKAVSNNLGAIYVGTLMGWNEPTALFTMDVIDCVDAGNYSVIVNGSENPMPTGMLGAYWMNFDHDANHGQQSNDINIDRFYNVGQGVMTNGEGTCYEVISTNGDIVLSNLNGSEVAYDVAGISLNDDCKTMVINERFYAKSGNSIHVWMAEDGYTMQEVTVGCKGSDTSIIDFKVSPDDPKYINFEMPACDVEIGITRSVMDWSGNGSEADPYRIENCRHMDMLAERVNGGNTYEGKYFVLRNDLVYDGTDDNYTPVGLAWAKSFKGHFDGHKHVISGIRTTASVVGVKGVFGYMGGSVKELRLRDCTFAGKEYAGSIAAYVMEGGSVEDCAVMSDVKVTTTSQFAGGIVGCSDGSVARCTYRGSVEGSHYTGMIVGKLSEKGALSRNFYLSETEAYKGTGLEEGGSTDVSGASAAVVIDDVLEGVPEEYYLKYEDVVYLNKYTLFNNARNGGLLELYRTDDDATMDVKMQGLTLYKDGRWNALCLPFQTDDKTEMVTTDPESPLYGAEVMRLFNSSFDHETGTLTLEFLKSGYIEANKPYLMRWKAANGQEDVTDPTFKHVAINFEKPLNIYDTYTDMKCDFNPLVLGADNETCYAMSANGQLTCPKAETISAFTPYFELANGLKEEDVKQVVIIIDGTTAIDALEMMEPTGLEDGRWYTLDGRVLDGEPVRKGVYIHRGKRVLR